MDKAVKRANLWFLKCLECFCFVFGWSVNILLLKVTTTESSQHVPMEVGAKRRLCACLLSLAVEELTNILSQSADWSDYFFFGMG